MFGRFWRTSEPVVQDAPQPEPMPSRQIHVREPEDVYDPRPPVLRAYARAKAVKKQYLRPEMVAEQFLDWLRAEGYCAYPYISKDLDDSLAFWYEEHVVEPLDNQIVREFIATLPGVQHLRKRLNRYNPDDRILIQRLEARGVKEPKNGWRMWVYQISQEVPVETRATPEQPLGKPQKRRSRASGQPAHSRTPREPDVDNWGITWGQPDGPSRPEHGEPDEMPPQRRYA